MGTWRRAIDSGEITLMGRMGIVRRSLYLHFINGLKYWHGFFKKDSSILICSLSHFYSMKTSNFLFLSQLTFGKPKTCRCVDLKVINLLFFNKKKVINYFTHLSVSSKSTIQLTLQPQIATFSHVCFGFVHIK